MSFQGVRIKQVMPARIEWMFRKVLYLLIVGILGGLIFASISPILNIKAAPPPKVAEKLLDEFFSARETLPQRIKDDEQDTTNLPESGASIALTVTVTELSSGDPSLPGTFFLSQNYPNPFNPQTTIEYSLPEQAWVRLEIYNSLGQRVTVLVDRIQQPGNYTIEWRGDNRASGVYFYRITAGEYRKTRKMVLLK